jgi:hypothetical protein
MVIRRVKIMRRGQVFVRAQTPTGRWVNADVLDLDELSYRAFIVEQLMRIGAVYSLKDNQAKGEEVCYKTQFEIDETPDDKNKGGVK